MDVTDRFRTQLGYLWSVDICVVMAHWNNTYGIIQLFQPIEYIYSG
jgi:hypothetical protein